MPRSKKDKIVKQRRAPPNADRIIWRKEDQFKALKDGWAIIHTNDQFATIVMYNTFGKVRFITPHDATIHVIEKSDLDEHGLHMRAIKFVRQQKDHHWNGSWERSCPASINNLDQFYRLRSRRERAQHRLGNRVAEHQRLPPPPSLIVFTKQDQYHAALAGWVLAMSPVERCMVIRTCDLAIFPNDQAAEARVRQLAEAERFHAPQLQGKPVTKLDGPHCRALEFMARWRADPDTARSRARYGMGAMRMAIRFLEQGAFLVKQWY